MQISDNLVVTMNYTLSDDEGTLIDQHDDGSFNYLHGAGNIVPGLEKALFGKVVGDEVRISVDPEDAFGERNPELIQVVDRNMFSPDELEITAGVQFHAESPDGNALIITVTEVNGDQITIDGNHPLAGTNLNYFVKIVGIREASAEELAHGHVHSPDSHNH